MKKNKILFLKEENFKATLFCIDKEEEIYSVKSELNRLAKSHFFPLTEYYKLVRKQLPLKNKIPIYFSSTLLLFCLKDKNTHYWINFFNILKICYDKELIVVFNNFYTLKINIKKSMAVKEIKKIKMVLNYRNSLNL